MKPGKAPQMPEWIEEMLPAGHLRHSVAVDARQSLH